MIEEDKPRLPPNTPTINPSYIGHFRKAAIESGLAEKFGGNVDRAARILQAISLRENPQQRPRAVGRNRNGTGDHGLMQINDVNISDPELRKNIYDPYTNILTGAQIFDNALGRANGDILAALSIYNRGGRGERNEKGEFYNQDYVNAVREHFSRLERDANYRAALIRNATNPGRRPLGARQR